MLRFFNNDLNEAMKFSNEKSKNLIAFLKKKGARYQIGKKGIFTYTFKTNDKKFKGIDSVESVYEELLKAEQ